MTKLVGLRLDQGRPQGRRGMTHMTIPRRRLSFDWEEFFGFLGLIAVLIAILLFT